MKIGNYQFSPGEYCRHIVCVLSILITVTGLPEKAIAASVLETGLADMLRACELVFEGRVTRVESRIDPQTEHIRTYVTLDVLDVIKGNYLESTVNISFLGGIVDDITVRVADMSLPKLNATGIFFVESLTRQQVHPLYGWSQGHIAIVDDGTGTRRVMTEDGQPIIDVYAEKQPKLLSRTLSSVVARGLKVATKGRLSDAMTLDAFKLALAKLLAPY